MFITWPLTYTGHAGGSVNRKACTGHRNYFSNNSLSPTNVSSSHCKIQNVTTQQLLAKKNRVSNACNWLSIQYSTLVAEANAGCFLVTGAWGMSKGYVMNTKSVYVIVSSLKNKMQHRSFQTKWVKLKQELFPDSVLAALKLWSNVDAGCIRCRVNAFF